MTTTQPPLAVGEIVGDRAYLLMPGDVLRYKRGARIDIEDRGYYCSGHRDGDADFLSDKELSDYTIVSLVPRTPVINYEDVSDEAIVKLLELAVDPNLLWQPFSDNAIDWPSFVALKIPVVRDWINQNFRGVK